MKIAAHELIPLARIIKAAAEEPDKEEEVKKEKPKAKKKRKPKFTAAYPDYSRSLVTQTRQRPVAAGLRRGASTGALGAILGALAARLATKDPRIVGGGAAAGGALGAIPGYVSGKREARSDYSRLLFLRRLGISRPGELEALQQYPETTRRITEKGTVI